MSSQPPGEPPTLSGKPPKPPNITPLKLEGAIIAQDYSATPNSSSSSEVATTPLTSSSSISDIVLTPDNKRGFPFLNPRGFFSSASSGSITDRPPSTPRKVIVENKESSTPSSSPVFSSSSSGGSTSFLSTPTFKYNSVSMERDKAKEKHSKKKSLRKDGLVLHFQDDAFEDRDYSSEHRGILERYAVHFKSNSDLRQMLGIDSFAEDSSIGQFFSDMVKLDLETKVLVSISGVMRIALQMKGETQEKLLNSLKRYDRSMSYWLLGYDAAMNAYQQYMTDIFFENKELNCIQDLFYKIPEYAKLSDDIKEIISERKYQSIYQSLLDSLSDYKDKFSLALATSHLKKVDIVNQEIKKEIEKKSGDLKRDLCSIPQFTEKFTLKKDFFIEFSVLRDKEACEDSKIADEKLKALPTCNGKPLSEEYVLNVCLYFFRALCNKHLKFYELRSGERLDDMYINKKFILKFNQVKRTDKFVRFMEKQKKAYNKGLLEIVLYRTLKYISENFQIRIDYSTVIEAALNAASAKLSKLIGSSLYNYGEGFFEEPMRIAFKHIMPKFETVSENKSGPSPKIW